jgi:hypothetical protein
MKHLLLLCLVLGACSDDSISSDEQARRAYLGLDKSIGKSITLGFDGFNAASSANIDPQMTTGDATPSGGTLTITGQVDQGSSSNKRMRLFVGMVGYNDGPFEIDDAHHTISVTYDTSMTQAEQPALDMMLKNIPSGTLDGTLMGTYHLTGDIKADATLNLTFTGMLMSGGNNTVVRVPGSTHVTGTATSGDGVYMVDVTI